MKFKILISLLAIIAVAGCTIPGIPGITPGPLLGTGSGLEITSFTAQPETVYSGSTVRIIMEVENKGETTVSSGKSIAYLTGSNIEFSSIPSTDMVWHDTSQYQTIKEMKSQDVVRGITGSTDRISWTLTSPTIPRGQTRADTFIGRVYCDYKTTSQGSVWVYSESEAEASRTAGRSLEKSSFTSTKGPVGLDVTVQPDPVILYTGENTFSINIKITNLATGTIYKPSNITYDTTSNNKALISDALNKVKLNITMQTGKIEITTDECKGNIEQELVAGRPTTIICDFEIKEDLTSLTFKSYPISVSIDYGYFTERTATVTVQGK